MERATRPRELTTISDEAFSLAYWIVSRKRTPLSARMLDDAIALRGTPEWANWARAASSAMKEVLRYEPPLESIRTPALVVHGASDHTTWPSFGEALARRLPNATLRVLGDCGHVPELECPEKLVDAVLPFLREKT
jgi:pimeloyl-ACP methyl ester carboxylesterase